MTLALYDRVQETTTTTGTGSVTLAGAVSGYQSFAVVGNGNTCYYTIVNNAAWEVGIGTYSTTGPTLARTTVLSNSNGDTTPITLSGSSSVFLTYPAEKSVNLDASGNVSPLGTVSSGTWHGATVGVAYGGTGVTTSSGANSVVLRDANGNIVGVNNVEVGLTSTTSSGGTTALTAASTQIQLLVGSANQTYTLPDATTLSNVGVFFTFANASSGTLTVKDFSGTTLETISQGGASQALCINKSTVAGTWGVRVFASANTTWGNAALNFPGNITGATWQGNTVAGGYGGTGLTSFAAANNALYSTGTTTLTAGTLPVAAGGTGVTSLTAGHVPYGNGSSFASSSAFQFNGTYLVVGGTTPLSGATNPITAFSSSANQYVQTYVYNANSGTSASADFVAYANNSTDAHGWADMGFTSSTYADATYTVTGPNEAYIFGSAPSGAGATGNLVYATDSTGSANAHQWYVGGFTQLKSAWKMQLTSTGLQLANALALTYGGTGGTTAQAGMNNLAGAVTSGSYLRGNGTNVVMSTIQAADVPTLNQNTTGQAGSVANALTFATTGGASAGSTYNGSAARTIDYSSIGAAAVGQTMYIGTTAVAINRTTGSLSLTGVNVDGSAGTFTSTSQNSQFNSVGVGTAGSGTAGEIRATNNITAYYSSDIKFKENVQPIQGASEIVRAIGADYFDWTDAYIAEHGGEDGYFVQKSDFGVIAQKVQAVFPKAVRTRPDGSLAVDYEKLGVLAFPALVETMDRLEALEARLAKLEK